MGQILIALAALIHVYIFLLESVLWGRPRTNKAFGVNAETAEINRAFAFNQGFYNLFLAIASIIGLALVRGTIPQIGWTLVAYSALSMVGAALILILSQPKLLRPALIQGLPPLLGLAFLYLGL